MSARGGAGMSNQYDQTMKFKKENDNQNTVQDILSKVYASLEERGYDPINQLVGYIISGDPTYITSYNNARYLIRRLERDEILEELVGFYLKHLDERKK
jgi:uncharacterized protein (UPF0297 family)